MDEDVKWMKRALRLAERGLGTTSPNPMVGAVIARNGELLGEGWHVRAGEGHAEVNAIRNAAGKNLKGSTIYVTLEPCSSWGRTPPCTDAIAAAGISKVVIGCFDPNPKHNGRSVSILKAHGIDVIGPVCGPECEKRNEAFFKWITTGKPFVLLKLAETLDGKIAAENGSSRWITGEIARARVQKLRLWADVVMAGANTYRTDAPQFTVRTKDGKILKTPRRIIVTHHPERFASCPDGWEFVSLNSREAWDACLTKLGGEGMTSLLIEGGGELAASALKAGAVDKVEFHIAPKVLGGRFSRPSVGGESPEAIAEAMLLDHVEIHKLGGDIAVSGYIRS